jgi:hypothetical protein
MHVRDTGEKCIIVRVPVSAQYVAVGVYNTAAAKTLTDTDGVTKIVLTPLYPEIQAAA